MKCKSLLSLLFVFISQLIISDVWAQLNLTFASRFKVDYTYDIDNVEDTTVANIWGWTNPADGKEYALLGSKDGTNIVDVTNPYAPFEVQFVPGTWNLWKEVKTYQHYAYVVSEGNGHGLKIINLQNLPTSVTVNTMNISASNRAHALFVDETQGYLYLFGMSGFAGGGCAIYNLNPDPMNPVYVGQYNSNYIHDGYVRNNKLYAGAIYAGKMQIIDVTNKAAPVLLGSVTTPTAFTHNTWLNDAGDVCFTTDENSGSYVGAYNITDPTDIIEIDRERNHSNGGAIVHNVHNYNDWLYASYYADGISIFDVHVPDIMVEVAYYDCSTAFSGNVFESVWGVYPYFSSNKIIVSDIQLGMYVLIPNLVRASYVRGVVQDACGNPLSNVYVQIPGLGASTYTDAEGKYKFGFNNEGTYDITFTLSPYVSQTITETLTRSIVDTLDVTMHLPTTTISVSPDDSICSGTTATLSSTATTSGVSYGWFKDGVALGSSSTTYAATTSGSYYFQAQKTSPPCTENSDTIQIVVTTVPAPVISSMTSVICGGGQYEYSIDDIPGSTIVWTVTNGTIISGQGTPNVIIQWDNVSSAGTLDVTQTAP